MTSEKEIKTGWSCGWGFILEELGRIAVLEYPIFPIEKETESPPHRQFPKAPPPAQPRPISPTSSTSSTTKPFTMPIPRMSPPRPAFLRPRLFRSSKTPLRPFSNSGLAGAWAGRSPDEHPVNRTDEKDVQAEYAQQGMREKDKCESNARSISEKGGDQNKKAEQDKPLAPKPVIGMNDERGSKVQ